MFGFVDKIVILCYLDRRAAASSQASGFTQPGMVTLLPVDPQAFYSII